MASISTAILAADVDHALLDFQVTLTTVLPSSSVGVEFTASRTSTTLQYMVDLNGRETEIEQAFYININGVTTYPDKGWVLNDGTRDLKVALQQISAGDVLLKIDCTSRYQRGR